MKLWITLLLYSSVLLGADFEYSEKVVWKASKDGSYTKDEMYECKPLNRDYLESAKKLVFYYDSLDINLNILMIEKCRNGKCEKQDLNDVYEESVSENLGRGSERKKIFVLNGFKLGDSYRYHYIKTYKAKIEGYFSEKLKWKYGVLKDGYYQVVSDLPMTYEINKLEGFVKKKTKHEIVIHIKKKMDVYDHHIPEENVVDSYYKYPFVKVSTFKTWGELRELLKPKFKNIKLPRQLQAVVALIKKEKNLQSKLQRLYLWINANFTYFGDWSREGGALSPRSIKTILSSKYIDCKDVSYLTVLILRELGLSASEALVSRSPDALDTSYEIVSPWYFNHVVVYLNYNGQSFWLDFTNPSYGHGYILDDILLKPALVLRDSGEKLKEIKLSATKKSIKKIYSKIKRRGSQFYISEKQISLGNMGHIIATHVHDMSREELDDYTLRYLSKSRNGKLLSYKLKKGVKGILDEKVLDLEFTKNDIFDYKLPQGSMLVAQAKFDKKIVRSLTDIIEGRELVSYLLDYEDIVDELEIFNYRLEGRSEYKCEVENKWFQRTFSAVNTKAGVKILNRLVVKNPEIDGNKVDKKKLEIDLVNYRECFLRGGVILSINK